jgi:hypothetical protein
MAKRDRRANSRVQVETINAVENDGTERKSDTMSEDQEASRLIDAKIEQIGDWRGEMLARLRALIKEADPDVAEAIKWRKPSNPSGVAVWEHDGIICTGETYKGKVKLTFARGASLADPSGLLNGSLNGNVTRAIDIIEQDKIDERAFKALIRAAVEANVSARKK